MYRFVALAWNPADKDAARLAEALSPCTAAADARRNWEAAFAADGLSVWQAGARPGRMQALPLANGGGVVLGQLFRTSPAHDHVPVTGPLGAADSAACRASRGRHLAERFWGRYVAFFTDSGTGGFRVMRDPGGAFPCYLRRHRGVDILFSDVEDVADLPGLRFAPDMRYLAANLMLPGLQKRLTGLGDVEEVLPAESRTLARDRAEAAFVWSPFEIAATEPLADRAAAAEALRRTVHGAVRALASGRERILHNLGGLDSSIVLACLAAMPDPPAVKALTMATASPAGDERHYACAAAAAAGVPLIEAAFDPARVSLESVFAGARRVAPMVMFDCTAPAAGLYDIAAAHGADALFYGVGGDNAFFQLPQILSALDYAREGRGRDRLMRVMAEASRYGGRSLPRVAWAMLKEYLRPAPSFEHVYDLIAPTTSWPLVNPDLVAAGPPVEALHPLLAPRQGMAKGKYYHILTTALLSPDYYDQWQTGDNVERVHPLTAQPVVELCLRIPTWVLVHGGVDRGLARSAFWPELAPANAGRISKSNPDTLYQDVYEANRALVAEILLDGRLVRDRILARAPLERMLFDDDLLARSPAAAMLEFLSWEAWLQRWA